jgi:hypothetical protein
MARTQEFRVVLDGVTLPKAATDRINKAIQQAVATEIAQLDLNKGDLLYHIGPGLRGIILRALSANELKGAGIDFKEQERGLGG